MCAAQQNHLDGWIKNALKFLESCLCTADEILSAHLCRVSQDHSAKKKNGRISSLAETPSASVCLYLLRERRKREAEMKERRHRCFLTAASYRYKSCEETERGLTSENPCKPSTTALIQWNSPDLHWRLLLALLGFKRLFRFSNIITLFNALTLQCIHLFACFLKPWPWIKK